jgi:hypothetical protein
MERYRKKEPYITETIELFDKMPTEYFSYKKLLLGKLPIEWNWKKARYTVHKYKESKMDQVEVTNLVDMANLQAFQIAYMKDKKLMVTGHQSGHVRGKNIVKDRR